MTTAIAKYILKEFFNKDAYQNIYVSDSDECSKCLQFLENTGIRWRGGEKPTQFTPWVARCYLTVNHKLTWKTARSQPGNKVIKWSELSKIISLFET